MGVRRGFVLTASVFGVAVMSGLSGCGGLGLAPAAPATSPATAGAFVPAPTSAIPSDPTSGAPTSGAPTAPPASPAPGGESPSSADPTGATQPAVPDTVARMTGGNGSAIPLLVPTSALPAGWTATQARNTRGYRMTVCGVDLEPVEPVDGAQQNWQKSAGGPYLEQHVRVYADTTATTVVDALTSKMRTCDTYTAKDTKGQSTFKVEKLTLKGAPSGTVAWRQRVPYTVPGAVNGTATSSPRTVQVVQDVAIRRTGAAVVLLNAYAVGADPDDATLVKALTSIG